MGAALRQQQSKAQVTTTTEAPDWTLAWHFFFFSFDRPGATIFIAGISIVHSLFHIPHLLMYRRLGILTAFWSLVGVGLVIGAVMEKEVLYDAWIWYSSVYVPVMLVIMCIVLTASVWALDLKPLRAIFATVAVLFYLFMFYCIIFVQTEKRKIFSTTTAPTTITTPCPWCPTCTTPKCTTPTTTKTTKKAGGKGLLRTLDMLFDENLSNESIAESLNSTDRDWTLDWYFHPPLSIEKPGATIFVGTVSIVHSLCHIPHLLMYRRLGMFTAFWSIVGLGLIFGAILEDEWLYDIWIWYSCVYVPVMLVTMFVVLAGAVWALNIQPLRAVFATVAILFYLFMFYCIVYVMSEKRKLFTTTTTTTTTTSPCPHCPTCTTQRCTTPITTTKAKPKKGGKNALRLIQYLSDRV